ncbi:hypothetical protein [Hymenobacter radiodurans]|uniref:hypothetical protein n=1 Tax=Hymenobacter radiodurans TaxID=2496028 RepID=UPI001058EE65|nr:hypothetical protein [Hymenobacter radiodurans]
MLVSLQSCKYDDGEEYKPHTPYYQFTAQDKLWFNYKVADSLIFENSTGKQQLYIVIEIKEEIKKGAGYASFGFFGRGNPDHYYDGIKVELKRLDTLSYNRFEFRRTLPQGANILNGYPPGDKGEFKFGGDWTNYNGGETLREVSGNINVSSEQLDLRNTSKLIVRGKTYNNIITIIPSQPNGPIWETRKPYINTLYYDQKAGLVRMISKSGEVWDRIL